MTLALKELTDDPTEKRKKEPKKEKRVIKRKGIRVDTSYLIFYLLAP